MGDIFISYSQPDGECAFELVARLESEGISCWIAPRDIAPASDWAAEIIEAISAAKMMVLVFSASSNDSAQVRREVERAIHKQIHILPFRIENILPSKSLEYFLSTQHWMDAFAPPREPSPSLRHRRPVLRRIRAWVGALHSVQWNCATSSCNWRRISARWPGTWLNRRRAEQPEWKISLPGSPPNSMRKRIAAPSR
jgi:hypothetical protein